MGIQDLVRTVRLDVLRQEAGHVPLQLNVGIPRGGWPLPGLGAALGCEERHCKQTPDLLLITVGSLKILHEIVGKPVAISGHVKQMQATAMVVTGGHLGNGAPRQNSTLSFLGFLQHDSIGTAVAIEYHHLIGSFAPELCRYRW